MERIQPEALILLQDGKVVQAGSPRELYLQPVNAFVAGFIGSPPMNFFRGRLTGDGIDLKVLRSGGASWQFGGTLLLGCGLNSPLPPRGPAGRVEVVEQLGAESFLYLRLKGLTAVEQSDRPSDLSGSVCARLNEMADLRPGDRVSLAVQPNLVHLFDAKSGESRLVVC